MSSRPKRKRKVTEKAQELKTTGTPKREKDDESSGDEKPVKKPVAAKKKAGGGGGKKGSKKLYCICQQPYNARKMMIGCDSCDEWYHITCVAISKEDAEKIPSYKCPVCEDKEKGGSGDKEDALAEGHEDEDEEEDLDKDEEEDEEEEEDQVRRLPLQTTQSSAAAEQVAAAQAAQAQAQAQALAQAQAQQLAAAQAAQAQAAQAQVQAQLAAQAQYLGQQAGMTPVKADSGLTPNPEAKDDGSQSTPQTISVPQDQKQESGVLAVLLEASPSNFPAVPKQVRIKPDDPAGWHQLVTGSQDERAGIRCVLPLFTKIGYTIVFMGCADVNDPRRTNANLAGNFFATQIYFFGLGGTAAFGERSPDVYGNALVISCDNNAPYGMTDLSLQQFQNILQYAQTSPELSNPAVPPQPTPQAPGYPQQAPEQQQPVTNEE